MSDPDEVEQTNSFHEVSQALDDKDPKQNQPPAGTGPTRKKSQAGSSRWTVGRLCLGFTVFAILVFVIATLSYLVELEKWLKYSMSMASATTAVAGTVSSSLVNTKQILFDQDAITNPFLFDTHGYGHLSLNTKLKQSEMLTEDPIDTTPTLNSQQLPREVYSLSVLSSFDCEASKVVSMSLDCSFSSSNTYDNPFSLDEHDFRLLAGGLWTFNNQSGIYNAIVMTNQFIYAVVGRSPFARDALHPFRSYEYVIPLIRRTGPNVVQSLQINYDRDRHTVQFFVDKDLLYTVDNPGQLLTADYMTVDFGGSIQQKVTIESISYSLGIYSFFDAYPTCTSTPTSSSDVDECRFLPSDTALFTSNPDVYRNPRNTTQAAHFQSSTISDTLFGQSGRLQVKKMVVYKAYRN